MNLWLDLEGVDASAADADVIAYAQEWGQAVAASGFVPGVYVGANSGRTSQLLTDLGYEHYWRSCSEVPDVQRGYQMVQRPCNTKVAGTEVDIDRTQGDDLGGQVLWLAPEPLRYPTLQKGGEGWTGRSSGRSRSP